MVAEVAEARAVVVLVGEGAAEAGQFDEEDLGVVDEDLGGDGGAVGPVGLVAEPRDATRGVHCDDGLVGGLAAGDVGGDDGALGTAPEVFADDGAQVEAEDVVGAHDDDGVRGELPDLPGDLDEVVGVAVGEAGLAGGATLLGDQASVAPRVRSRSQGRPWAM